jgi:hypothetical protein
MGCRLYDDFGRWAAGARPRYVLDRYEHFYHMDFGAKAPFYVDAHMEAIRWDNAVKLYGRYSTETGSSQLGRAPSTHYRSRSMAPSWEVCRAGSSATSETIRRVSR